MKKLTVILIAAILVFAGCQKKEGHDSKHESALTVAKEVLVANVIAEAKKNLDAVEIAKLGTEIKKSRAAFFEGLDVKWLKEFSENFDEKNFGADDKNFKFMEKTAPFLISYEKKFEKTKQGFFRNGLLILRVTDKEAANLYEVLEQFISFVEKGQERGCRFNF